jgi:uncharacterized membrane protein/glutaredoxin
MLITNSNLANVAFNYLKRLKVPVTKSTLKLQLQTNPYYPSLYSLSSVFERFKIDNQAYKIEKEKLDEVQPPYIAFLKQVKGRDFVLVTNVSENNIKYITSSNKEVSVPREKFLKDWDSTFFIAEGNEHSGEADYEINHKKEITERNKARALVAGGGFIFVYLVYSFLDALQLSQFVAAITLLVIKFLGLSVTILLLVYEIDKSNSFVKSICTASKQANCDAVLNSKAANVLGMSWSEAGFFYFASTFLFLFLSSLTLVSKISILAIANCLAAPYIIYSIYFQWKVVKQWCPLCLTIQAVLIMEVVWSIFNFWIHPFFNIALLPIALVSITFCITLPMVLWFSLRDVFIKAKDEPVYKAAYNRILYNPETFNNLLLQQPAAPLGYEQIGITLGNPDAANTIIKVCNPYCGPCAKAHPLLDEIIHHNKSVKVKLIFSVSNDEKDYSRLVAKHLMAISAKQNEKLTEMALDDWYLAEKNEYNLFAAKHPIKGELKEQEAELEEMREWCKEANIKGTPTLFINGHKLPENYKIEELKYIFG